MAFHEKAGRSQRTSRDLARAFPSKGKSLRTTSARWPSGAAVCFVNVESVDRIIHIIFQRFNLEWKTRTLNLFTQAA